MNGLEAFKQAVSEQVNELALHFNPATPKTKLEHIILKLRTGQWLSQRERRTVAKMFAQALFLIDAFTEEDLCFSDIWKNTGLTPYGLEIQTNYFIFFSEETANTDTLQIGQCKNRLQPLHFFSDASYFKHAPLYISFKLYYVGNVDASAALIGDLLKKQYHKLFSRFILELFDARLEKIQLREATIHLIKQRFAEYTENKPKNENPLSNASAALLDALQKAIELHGINQRFLSLIWGTLILEESEKRQTKYFVQNAVTPKIISFYSENNSAFKTYLSPMYQLTTDARSASSKRNLIIFRLTQTTDTSDHDWLVKVMNNMTPEWTILPIALDDVKKRIFTDKNIQEYHSIICNSLNVESDPSSLFQQLIALFKLVQNFCSQHVQALPEWIWGSQKLYQQWLGKYLSGPPKPQALVAFINYALWCDYNNIESTWKCIFLRYESISSILAEQQARGLGIHLGFSSFPSLQDLRAWDQIFNLVVNKTAIQITEEYQHQYTKAQTTANLLPAWTHNINDPLESINNASELINKGVEESLEKLSLNQPNQAQLILEALPIYYDSIRYKTKRIASYTKLITAWPKLDNIVESELKQMKGKKTNIYDQIIEPVFSHLMERIILATDEVTPRIRNRLFQVEITGIPTSQKLICHAINKKLFRGLYSYHYIQFKDAQPDTLQVIGLCLSSSLHKALEEVASDCTDTSIKDLEALYKPTTDTYYLNKLKTEKAWELFSSILKMSNFYEILDLDLDTSLYTHYIPESNESSYLKILCIEALIEVVWNALKHGNESNLSIIMKVNTQADSSVLIMSVINSFEENQSDTSQGEALIKQIVTKLEHFASFKTSEFEQIRTTELCFTCQAKSKTNEE